MAVAGARAAATAHGLHARALDAEELRRRYPVHVITGGEVAVLDVLAGFLRPEAAVAAMIERLVALGGEIRCGVVVKDVSGRADGVEVTTDETRSRSPATTTAS